MPIFSIRGIVPVVDPTSFVHPTAALIGDVFVGARCYIGPGASLRGDLGRILIGEGSNIQDNCVIHTYPGEEASVARDGHIGHGVVLHGCRLMEDVLVGMNAVVMDGAIIGQSSVVAAMACVKARFEVPPRSLVAGTPAEVVKTLDDAAIARKREGTLLYQRLARLSLATSREVAPLREADAARLDTRHARDLGAA